MRSILTNYYKTIAMPSCLALIFGMPLAAIAADPGMDRSYHEEQHQGGDAYQDLGGDAPAQTLDPQTKEQFVAAYVEIQEIQNEYSEKLQGAADEDQARDIQQQAQDEMIQAVENNGMSINEYNEVVGIISADPELRMEIEELAQAQR
jgi:hypothetical protein